MTSNPSLASQKTLQIWFPADRTKSAIATHSALFWGLKQKLLPIFDNASHDAELLAKEEFDRIGRSGSSEDPPDEADAWEWASQRGQDRYDDLVFVREQLILMGIAGIYHLWERTLKRAMVREFEYNRFSDVWRKRAHSAPFPLLKAWIETIDKSADGHILDTLHTLSLVANVAKHGDGNSCKALAGKVPDFFKTPGWLPPLGQIEPEAEDLVIAPRHLDDFAAAVTDFWTKLPERCFVAVSPSGEPILPSK